MNEVISYREMCDREGVQTLQRGMNFRLNRSYSVILMSLRRNAPYRDRVEENGRVLIYEGHDAHRTNDNPDPKRIDQPEFTPNGSLTQNGHFHQAAQSYKQKKAPAEIVKVYQKLWSGIWSDNGFFQLVDSWQEDSEGRSVFKFKLIPDIKQLFPDVEQTDITQTRFIPTEIKQAVWKRDKGRCVICGAQDNLHFDHIIPYSKGGSSLVAENIQLLCARHNLEKRDKII